MLSCLDKMYTQKYKKSHKSWAISFQNALFSNPMNIIKNNADGASEKGCRLVITGDIVENSVGLSKVFDIYITIFKCLSYYYKDEELKYLTEQTFEKIVKLNFVHYGEFINSPKEFVEKNFKDEIPSKGNYQEDIENHKQEEIAIEKEIAIHSEISINDSKDDSKDELKDDSKDELKSNINIETIKPKQIEKEEPIKESVMSEEPFKNLSSNDNDNDDDDDDDDFDPDIV